MDFWILVPDSETPDEAGAFLIRGAESVEAAIALALQKRYVSSWENENEAEGNWDVMISLNNHNVASNVIVFDKGGAVHKVKVGAALNVEIGEQEEKASA